MLFHLLHGRLTSYTYSGGDQKKMARESLGGAELHIKDIVGSGGAVVAASVSHTTMSVSKPSVLALCHWGGGVPKTLRFLGWEGRSRQKS